MEEFIIKFISRAEPVQLFSMCVMFWFFYSRLNGKIENIEIKLTEKFDKFENKLNERFEKFEDKLNERCNKFESKLNERCDKMEKNIDNLSSKIEDVDRRLCRIEGSLSTHGHCLFYQSANEKKAL